MSAKQVSERGRAGQGGVVGALRPAAGVREALRGEIVAGALPPGARLPTHAELAARFGVSNVTIQRALGQLEAEGFVVGRPRLGTLVVESPPHLHQIGLVFWNDPKAPLGSLTWSRYFQALTLAATDFERSTGRRMLQFHGVHWHPEAPDRRRLIEHLETHRLAGVVFANIPLFLEGSPILELPGIPRVAFETRSQHPNVRTVNFDFGQWLDKALDYLAAQGCRRVAVIKNAVDGIGFDEPDYQRLCEALATRGMFTHSRWLQLATMNLPTAARQAAEILMADREPPDALLITDDNYVEPALAGLVAAGVRVPDDLAVVGHANYPLPPAKTLPIRLLGYDQRAMLHAAVEIIDRCRAGETPPATVTLPALWEEEVGKQG